MDTLLEYVLAELDARRGSWAGISRAIEPDAWEAHYSWLTKVGQKRIPNPGVVPIQKLADYFRATKRKAAA